MRRPIKESKSEQKKAPTYLKITSILLVISTIITGVRFHQNQEKYNKMIEAMRCFNESLCELEKSTNVLRESTDELRGSIEQFAEESK